MTILMPVVGRLVDKVGARTMILTGLPLLALTTWQMGALDMTTSDTTIKLWLLARGASMGLVMMPSMTAGLNAVSLPQMSRASSITNVMRQLFGSFGTAMVVTILQSRQTFPHRHPVADGHPRERPAPAVDVDRSAMGYRSGPERHAVASHGRDARGQAGRHVGSSHGFRRRLSRDRGRHPAGNLPGPVYEDEGRSPVAGRPSWPTSKVLTLRQV